ncbi:hypothetical protein AGMMS49936_11630 [Endomicrobiia bacterium]|nr:hypothetical protein AGMMS49936_11630 [Endomicrobiia bacterium]
MLKLISKISVVIIAASLVTIVCIKLSSNKKTSDIVSTIPPNVKSKVVVTGDKVVVTKTSNSSNNKIARRDDFALQKLEDVTSRTKTYIAPEAKVTHTVQENGAVEIKIQNKGFCFTPELMTAIDKDHGYLGLGAKFFYWSRFSASAGCGVYDFNKLVFKPYVSVDYTIPYLKNTKVALNYNFSNIGVKLSISL